MIMQAAKVNDIRAATAENLNNLNAIGDIYIEFDSNLFGSCI